MPKRQLMTLTTIPDFVTSLKIGQKKRKKGFEVKQTHGQIKPLLTLCIQSTVPGTQQIEAIFYIKPTTSLFNKEILQK